jgi:MYXO-CTERM domain-containing protein
MVADPPKLVFWRAKMNIRSTVLLLIFGAELGVVSPANAQDLFGRTEPKYDLTGDPRTKNFLDYAYINGEVPTFAERKGLAGLPTVEVRRNFVYVQDSDGSLNIPWQSQDDIFNSFNFALNELYQVLPDEFIFVYLFTAFDTGVGAFFYTPEAQSDRGIGEQRFDNNGFSPREGFVFMNYWKSFEQVFQGAPQQVIDAQARSVFNQEAGHRWASFVPTGADGNGSGVDVMLGRMDGHWSYFMQSEGSPMEGNAWRDNLNGTFTTVTSFDNWHFSDLDLYLMGVLPGNQVDDWWVILNPDTNGQTDLFGQAINRESPPQIIQQVTISGTRANISVTDVQAIHGLRDPAAGTAPSKWRVVFLMLAGQSSGLSASAKTEFEDMVDDYALGFKQGARSLAELDYLLMADPKSPIGGPCSTVDDCDQLEANICLQNGGSGTCTRACSSPTSCPSNYCCQTFNGSASEMCLPDAMCQAECTCNANQGSCDQGCGCDTDCNNPCSCDTSANCEANCSCDSNCNTGCSCDTSAACEANCACDANCNTGGCTCDTSFACDQSADQSGNCACDPECGPCECDLTFSCDGNCSCDPECQGGNNQIDDPRARGGCGCSAVETHGGTWLSLLLVSMLGIAFTRRRS